MILNKSCVVIQFSWTPDSLSHISGWIRKEETNGYQNMVLNIVYIFVVLSLSGPETIQTKTILGTRRC